MHLSLDVSSTSRALRSAPALGVLLLLISVVLTTLAAPPSLSGQAARAGTLAALASLPGASAQPLLIPVEGVRPEQLRNTYHDGRSEGREHLAIDIHARRWTPVLAAADGRVLRLHSGAKGGISLYQLGTDGRTRYYYAHLDGYAEGIAEGRTVRRGEVIGYVGDTGNATPGDTHLHFAIAILDDVSRWWEGTNLDPYPLLRAAAR
ncbi:MAG TPA: M23 family metallopeptidase [Longimicrobiaceae bacterium]